MLPDNPRVKAFLTELTRALAPAPLQIRKETLEEIRAHLDTSFGNNPTEHEIDHVITALGRPEDIAEAALASSSDEMKTKKKLTEPWVAPLVLLLQAIGLATPLFLLPGIAVTIAIVLCVRSPRYTSVEKLINSIASVLAPIGAAALLMKGLDGMDGCYDPATEKPLLEGMPTCDELYGPVSLLIYGLICALILATAITALVIAIRAGRRHQSSE